LSGPERSAPEREQDFSPGYANYVLAVLLVVYIFNFVDRQVLAILLTDIKADLGVSDTALGLLSGPAFAFFYTLAGIPIARWADRGTRRTIVSLGLLVWSGMTALCGVSQNFVQLALARIGVGVGEAAGSPPSHSLISDYFPPERRATALSIYAIGVYVGVMLGYWRAAGSARLSTGARPSSSWACPASRWRCWCASRCASRRAACPSGARWTRGR
jgi:MFS family permease